MAASAAARMLPRTMRAVVRAEAAATGAIEVVTRDIPVPKASEVLVKVHATALNRMDLLQAAGRYPVPEGVTDVLGVELAGEIVSGDVDGYSVGDRVMALTSGGSYAEYCTVEASQLMPIPEGMSMAEAAAIPETWLTAYQLLHVVGGPLKEGETVVVHAAGSGVGCAATQLASVGAGARVFATAGSQSKLDHAVSLGASAGYNYKEGAWAPALKDAAGERGVQLVLDCIGGSYVEQNLAVMSTDARWVLYGLMGGAGVGDGNPFLLKLLRKRIQLRSTTLRARSKAYKAELVANFAAHALPRFADKSYRPILDEKSFELDDAMAAHAYMASNANTGKIILRVVGTEEEKADL
jgi:tumor protein p53-inducible protein 3